MGGASVEQNGGVVNEQAFGFDVVIGRAGYVHVAAVADAGLGIVGTDVRWLVQRLTTVRLYY